MSRPTSPSVEATVRIANNTPAQRYKVTATVVRGPDGVCRHGR